VACPELFKVLLIIEREREGSERGRFVSVTPPLARAMAMIAADSMTHERGFHIKPKNLRSLLSFFSSSLFGPKICSLFWPSSSVKPSLVHFSCSKTSSIGIRSYTHNTQFMKSPTYYYHQHQKHSNLKKIKKIKKSTKTF